MSTIACFVCHLNRRGCVCFFSRLLPLPVDLVPKIRLNQIGIASLNTVPRLSESEEPVTATPNNADFLFGSEKVAAPPPSPLEVKLPVPVALEPPLFSDQRVIQPDHGVNPMEIQRQIQEFQRMQLRDQEIHQQQGAVYRRKNSEYGIVESVGYFPPPYAQTNPEAPPMNFWQGNQNPGGVFPAPGLGLPEQQVYMIPSPSPLGQFVGLPDTSAYTQVTYAGGMGKQGPPPLYHGIGLPVSGMSELRNGPDGKIVAMNMSPKVSSQSSDYC